MSRALSFMADPALAASVLPTPGTGFDIPSFLAEAGAVYLIAESVSEEAPVAPLSPPWPRKRVHVRRSARRRRQIPGPAAADGPDQVTQFCAKTAAAAVRLRWKGDRDLRRCPR